MGSSTGNDETANTTRERVRGGYPVAWFLVEGNRALVAGAMLIFGYVLLIVLGEVGPGSISKLFDPDPIFALFTPIVIGIIMGVSLVLTFNQLVLSQELGPVGDQRERMEKAMAFREDIETAIGRETSPPEPSIFLRGLVEATGEQAEKILSQGKESGGEFPAEIQDYATEIIEDADRVSNDLEGKQFGRFQVVDAALNYNYSWKIYTGRRLRNRHHDTLPAEIRAGFDDLIETLEFFGPAREHIKTLYFRWEIINISRELIYVSVPALSVAAYMILVFETVDIAGTTVGLDNGLLFVGGAFIVGVTPFALFLSHILRIVTVAKWTLAIGPFILRETDRGSDVDWE